jgi:hypothetical protein
MIAFAAVLLAASYNFSQALTVGAIGAVAGGHFLGLQADFLQGEPPDCRKARI